MPRHDPTPPQEQQRTATAWARYKQLMRWMALAAAIMVVLALIYLRATSATMPLGMVLATIGGVGLSMLVGTGLMGLVYFSSNSGHDESATIWDDSNERGEP